MKACQDPSELVVDGRFRTWEPLPGRGRGVYRQVGHRQFLAALGGLPAPVRTVRILAPAPDLFELCDVLLAAGEQAVATLAAALHRVDSDVPDESRPGPECVVTAGLCRQWESANVALLTRKVGPAVAESRIHPDAFEQITGILGRWVHGREVLVDVPFNLAFVIEPVLRRAGGFNAITDEELRLHPACERVREWACMGLFQRPARRAR